MIVRTLESRTLIRANDDTALRELFNPLIDALPISFSLAHASLPVGAASARHHLEGSMEIYYILSGEGRMHIDEDSRPVATGDTVVIPAGSIQWLENTGDSELCLLAMVEPAWRTEIDSRDE